VLSVLRLILVMVVLGGAIGQPVAADTTAGDRSAMETVVRSQLDAFAADRESEAYGYAAPTVQMIFPSIEHFMAMVKRGYQPVYRNTRREFLGSGADANGRPWVRVRLTDQTGKRHEALYFMEKQPDGSWKISGCTLLPLQDIGV
jgi:hypothetical protein